MKNSLYRGSDQQSSSFVYVVQALLLGAQGLNNGPIESGTDKKVTIEEIADKAIESQANKLLRSTISQNKQGSWTGRLILAWLGAYLEGEPKVSLTEGLTNTYQRASDYRSSYGKV